MLSTESTETKQLMSSPGSSFPGGEADNKQTTKYTVCQMGIDARETKKKGGKMPFRWGKGLFYSAVLRQASLEKRPVGNEAVGPEDI